VIDLFTKKSKTCPSDLAKRRAGKTYGKVKNQNRGDKNKKYEHPVNPNKKRK
jgi:hypothetical protein